MHTNTLEKAVCLVQGTVLASQHGKLCPLYEQAADFTDHSSMHLVFPAHSHVSVCIIRRALKLTMVCKYVRAKTHNR